ncbi:hypothetical protein Btru_044426 [Bulinus truncatus]|nr:hypothetical protein Btru_044426 [Bulinus truncatus]
MAACSKGDEDNAEIGQDLSFHVFALSEFVRKCVLPECVSVTDGSYLSKSVQISKGDVILLKAVESVQKVTISYKPENGRSRTETTLPLDYSQKFYVLPPKEISADHRAVSIVTYPSVSDLILDCPTYFEATSSYEDPYLPGCSVKAGDRFRFVEILSDSKDGTERLKVRDEDGNFILLSSECRANFCPLKDDKQYTVKELVGLAPVQRRLKLTAGDSRDDDDEGKECQDEYTQVVKPKKTLSPSSPIPGADAFPDNFSGIVHMQKPETMLLISPFNDPDTVWNLPVSANLYVRKYVQEDYEIPAPKLFQSASPRVPLPLKSAPGEHLPHHRAPITPQSSWTPVPMKINTFIDAHLSSFPVIARIMDTSESDSFYRRLLKGVDEVNVYRVEEAKRLFVRDVNSDTVYSLSHDLDVSFVEYPEMFKTVLDLLRLPGGSEVKVLEDIAADFPQPFSLRVGDILRITSTNPQFIKMKHAPRDCEVLKCLKIAPEGGEPTKVKIPLDFEIKMVMNTDRSSRKMISLQDLLAGSVPFPAQEVASVPGDSDSDVLKELPVDLQILKSMKETFLVVESKKAFHLPRTSVNKLKQSLSFPASSPTPADPMLGATAKCYSRDVSPSPSQRPMTNIGLPINSGILIAFKDRLDIYDMNVEASEADYVRIPVERMTYAAFEERERLRKLNVDYEDVEFGSSSTIDETGSLKNLHLMRAGSTGRQSRICISNQNFNIDFIGHRPPSRKYIVAMVTAVCRAAPLPYPRVSPRRSVVREPSVNCRVLLPSRVKQPTYITLYRNVRCRLLERKEKLSKLDKVRRFSKALHPKHWRQSRTEPEPLPHPSAMGLMALAARPHEGQRNEYEQQHRNSFSGGNMEEASDGEDHENLYEDVEIGPIKAATFAAPTGRQTGAFSGPSHMSLPLPRLPSRLLPSKKGGPQNDQSELENGASRSPRSDGINERSHDTNRLTKARNWATSLSSKFSKNEGARNKKERRDPDNSSVSLSFPPHIELDIDFTSSSQERAISQQHKAVEKREANDISQAANEINPQPTKHLDLSTHALSEKTKSKPVITSSVSINGPAPKAPVRKKALLRAALAQNESTSDSSDTGSSDLKENAAKNTPVKSEATTKQESPNTDKISTQPASINYPSEQNSDMNGKIEPPRPKPRNLNKIAPEARISNIPMLPPRGEAPPRVKAPDALGINAAIEKPKLPPKPKVSQHSEV